MSQDNKVEVRVREYTITTGYYSDHRIIARLAGPWEQSIDQFYDEFMKGYFEKYDRNLEIDYKNISDLRIHKRNQEYKSDGIRKLQKLGYKGQSLAEIFTNWLVLAKGFQKLEDNEIWIEE